MELTQRLETILAQVQAEHAPDLRTSVFEIELARENGSLALVGETSVPAAAEEIRRRLALMSPGLSITDRVRRLPSATTSHALVTSAIAPMLAGPLVSDSHISQTLVGHRLLVLRERGRWLHCRSTDGYLGWVHRGYIRQVEEDEAREWETGLAGEPCFSLDARLVGPAGEIEARLPWGARFVRRDDGTAVLPDGRAGELDGDWITERERAGRFPARGEAMVETAAHWLAAPYFWGGVTRAGVDCSGLAQAVYRTHGVDLPRDSDQQALCGVEIDPGPRFTDLLPGDLLFFAEEPGRVTHVTLSEGGSRIIHSSLGNGGVARNDLAGSLGYEEELCRIFVCARRLLTTQES
jgi:gamma-D-glutamyl-L-lysine dipeptidyl-peptidase